MLKLSQSPVLSSVTIGQSLKMIWALEVNEWRNFSVFFRSFLVNGDRQKNVDPHFRGLDLGAQVEFLFGIFFIPLVQSEFYQEISMDWSEHQHPSTDARRRSNTPPRVIYSITQFILDFQKIIYK